jgi:hypothetical protein
MCQLQYNQSSSSPPGQLLITITYQLLNVRPHFQIHLEEHYHLGMLVYSQVF